MKRKMIALTAFMTVVLAGCGQIDEPLTTTNSNNQAATQVEVQTASRNDAPAESTTEPKKTSVAQQTAEETSMKTTSITSIAETQAEDNAVSAVPENSDTSQTLAEEKQSVVESEKTATTAASTTQATTAQAETTNAPAVADNGQTADVFKMLDSLNYHAISCDGLPEYKLTAPDGTTYLLNISGGWVWRRPSLIADADNEAPLTQEIIDALYANWDKLNIVETAW